MAIARLLRGGWEQGLMIDYEDEEVGEGQLPASSNRPIIPSSEFDPTDYGPDPGPHIPCETASDTEADKRPIPTGAVLDADWEVRRQKREQCVAGIKESVDYQQMLQLRNLDLLDTAAAPKTPDATDRYIAKRTWEADAMYWRHEVKKHVNFHKQ
jgi:hypothetical protein